MKPTRILSDEHRVIEVVLDCLERLTEKAQTDGKLDGESARNALDFFRNFADQCHHGKEEQHLFTAMVQKGAPREGGPIAVMLNEHDQGRAFIRGMAEQIDAAEQGESTAIDKFEAHARGYVNLLRMHIQKEDNILFPMAPRFLDADDEKKLMEAFEKVESEHMGEGTHDKYLGIARTLAAKFEVSTDGIPENAGCCSHH
jgi:hemerythrin-like domain-containing protein